MSNITMVKFENEYTAYKRITRNSGLSLRAIGLLISISTQGNKQILKKTDFYDIYGRAAVEGAWDELHRKGYMFSVLVQTRRYRYYEYFVSSEKFTMEECEKLIDNLQQNKINKNSFLLKPIMFDIRF